MLLCFSTRAVLHAFETGRTSLPAKRVIEDLAENIGLAICDRSFIEVINLAEDLEWIRDPFDRIIVAHAMLSDVHLITKDRYIRRRYKKAVWS
jgi:PIN domain nuclease of toxin-antitoxin system